MLGQTIITFLLAALLPPIADTRLSIAAMNGDRATVEALLKQNVDVNAPQGDGSTALHWASDKEDLELVQLLIKAGADVNAKTRLAGITPIFMAAKNGNASIIQLLLKAGADGKGAT